MNALLSFALDAKFGKDIDTKSIIEVLEASGNEIVATEKLLGIYEEPKFPEKVKLSREKGKECTFISFDPFKKEIKYSCLYPSNVRKYYVASVVLDVTGERYAQTREVKNHPELFFDTQEECKKAYPTGEPTYNSFQLGELQPRENTVLVEYWK